MIAERTDDPSKGRRTMLDAQSLLFGMAVLIGLGLVVAIIVLASRRGRNIAVPPNSPGQRLAVLASQRPGYRIVVGVPPQEPSSWALVSHVGGDRLIIEGHDDVALTSVRAFVVAYPNGQVVDYELAGLPMPVGMTGLQAGRSRHDDVLQLTDLEEGRKYIEVSYGRSILRPRDRRHYATTLTNNSKQHIRVLRFAGYTQTPQGWKLNTVTGTFYSAREFREWYGLGQQEWVEPGRSVTDANNYGSPPVLWAYYCQSEDGEEFIVGGVLK